jgi:biopolymer transport protein ExbD
VRRRSVLDDAGGRVRVNVVPMIDIVMVLIVFYLMVGQLALNRAAGVEIPETPEGLAAGDSLADPVVIGVRADGTVLLDGVAIDPARLRGELSGRLTREPGARVEIRADRDAPFAAVRPAIDAARGAGIAEVELVTERGPGGVGA